MLHFFYDGDYTYEQTNRDVPQGRREITEPMLHAWVTDLAEDLSLPLLKALAARKFEAAVVDAWNTTEFVRVVQAVYEFDNLDKVGDLKPIMLRTVQAHRHELLSAGTRLRALLRSLPNFAADMLETDVDNRIGRGPLYNLFPAFRRDTQQDLVRARPVEKVLVHTGRERRRSRSPVRERSVFYESPERKAVRENVRTRKNRIREMDEEADRRIKADLAAERAEFVLPL